MLEKYKSKRRNLRINDCQMQYLEDEALKQNSSASEILRRMIESYRKENTPSTYFSTKKPYYE